MACHRELFHRNFWCFYSKVDEESPELDELNQHNWHPYATGYLAFSHCRKIKPAGRMASQELGRDVIRDAESNTPPPPPIGDTLHTSVRL